MQQKMLDFDIEDDNNVLQVKISLADVTKELQGEEKTKVTMECVKFIVYEQAEEVNEEWVGPKGRANSWMKSSLVCTRRHHQKYWRR